MGPCDLQLFPLCPGLGLPRLPWQCQAPVDWDPHWCSVGQHSFLLLLVGHRGYLGCCGPTSPHPLLPYPCILSPTPPTPFISLYPLPLLLHCPPPLTPSTLHPTPLYHVHPLHTFQLLSLPFYPFFPYPLLPPQPFSPLPPKPQRRTPSLHQKQNDTNETAYKPGAVACSLTARSARFGQK